MPTIYSHRTTGLKFQDLFGGLGVPAHVTGHYTATRRDTSDKDALALVRSFHRDHKNKSWGGLGYHFVITTKGNIILGRPVRQKGAHTGGQNSRNIGVAMLGTTGHKPTLRQRRAYRWLLLNAHKTKMPPSHRTSRPLIQCRRHGHNSWSGHHSNGCPGSFLTMYVKGR